MKIAVVSIGSFDMNYSDYHIMRDIIVGLLNRGHEVQLIQKQYLDKPQYPQQFEKYLGKQLQVINIPFIQKSKADLKARYLADLLYYTKACHMIKREKTDKIFLQSNNTAFVAVFYAKHILKRPILYNEQDIFPENAYFAGILSKKSLVYRIAYALQNYVYNHATALSTISDDMKSTIVNTYKIPKEKVQVVYNWGHEERKAHNELENTFLQKYPKMPGEFRVIYAGNLGKMQNVELILKTAALMKNEKDIDFYIVGDGINKGQLVLYARENQLTNVEFVPMQPQEQVADLYAAADVNIIPLAKGIIHTALPSKTADCLIAGKPVITCIEEKSDFVKLIEKYGVQNAGVDSPEELKRAILQVKEGKNKGDYFPLWNDYFTAAKGVATYCDAIECME